MNAPILSLQQVDVLFRERMILENISVDILPNTITSMIGPSGVGKSTLLRRLNRLLDENDGFKSNGTIFYNGIDLSFIEKIHLRREIGIVFQRPIIFPISIYKNVIFGSHHLKMYKKKEYPELVERLLKQVFLWDEVKDRLEQPALELSVGQQQRLSIARTLALKPSVLLMDEPTSALDVRSKIKIEELILNLKAKRTIILVTHELDQAKHLSDHLIALEDVSGRGRIAFSGNPKEFKTTQYLSSG